MSSQSNISRPPEGAAAFEAGDAAAQDLFAPVDLSELAALCQLGAPTTKPLQGFQCADVITDAATLLPLIEGWGAYWVQRLMHGQQQLRADAWEDALPSFVDRVEQSDRPGLIAALGITPAKREGRPDTPADDVLEGWLANMRMVGQIKSTLDGIAAKALTEERSKLRVLGVTDARGVLQAIAIHQVNESVGERGRCDLNDLATAPWNIAEDKGSVKGAGTVAMQKMIIGDLEAGRTGEIWLTPEGKPAEDFYTANFGLEGNSISSENAKASVKKSKDASVQAWVANHADLLR